MGKEKKTGMASNVTYGKPANWRRSIHIAPIGTKLPN